MNVVEGIGYDQAREARGRRLLADVRERADAGVPLTLLDFMVLITEVRALTQRDLLRYLLRTNAEMLRAVMTEGRAGQDGALSPSEHTRRSRLAGEALALAGTLATLRRGLVRWGVRSPDFAYLASNVVLALIFGLPDSEELLAEGQAARAADAGTHGTTQSDEGRTQ